jgi:hypothetical protein
MPTMSPEQHDDDPQMDQQVAELVVGHRSSGGGIQRFAHVEKREPPWARSSSVMASIPNERGLTAALPRRD